MSREIYCSTARFHPTWVHEGGLVIISSITSLREALSALEEVTLFLDVDALDLSHIEDALDLLDAVAHAQVVFLSQRARARLLSTTQRLDARCAGVFLDRASFLRAQPSPAVALSPRARSKGPASLRALFERTYRARDLVVQGERMREVTQLAARAAKSHATVLIHGESGTGKERLARFIHDESLRADGPFIAVNCKAFSESLLESELFGHVKGAFTGAERDHEGLFRRADGGTLFLDEIGEVSLAFQAKLLRVLQEKEVLPVGARRPERFDARLLVATNRDLWQDVEEGRFRQDLLYRLCVIPIEVPPLRERRDEIKALATHFIARHNHELGRRVEGWDDEVEAHLMEHAWPGNVRELENTIERACVMACGAVLSYKDLMLREPSPRRTKPSSSALQDVLDEATRDHLRRVLVEVHGSRKEAAAQLGIERTTLYRLMKKLHVHAPPR